MRCSPEKQSDSQSFLIAKKYFTCHVLLAGTSTKFCHFESFHLQKPINSFFFSIISITREGKGKREAPKHKHTCYWEGIYKWLHNTFPLMASIVHSTTPIYLSWQWCGTQTFQFSSTIEVYFYRHFKYDSTKVAQISSSHIDSFIAS